MQEQWIFFFTIKINKYQNIKTSNWNGKNSFGIKGGFREGSGGCTPPPFFGITCFSCNHFEELQTVLFEVELIINNTPLTYIYPNTIEICLTPNHLLFDRPLLYSSNTTLTVVRNLTVLLSTTDKINHISNHFLDR